MLVARSPGHLSLDYMTSADKRSDTSMHRSRGYGVIEIWNILFSFCEYVCPYIVYRALYISKGSNCNDNIIKRPGLLVIVTTRLVLFIGRLSNYRTKPRLRNLRGIFLLERQSNKEKQFHLGSTFPLHIPTINHITLSI